ncbi:TetR/AcrR family transcriptional regulator [Neobacillus terrae]|uniref:TetR/AcrR family transcriptional regulator n=1 Tax=Neobacillus terrae TaxID=3034837 RepID=UPI0014094F70|nr:TetR/AcrR family transcriptional regulator [Neobacillus terrae]NHM29231.1 TetR/AcrR family transcriptional regulator [Neobacillus terrae]
MLFITEMPNESKEKILFAGLTLYTSKGFKNSSVLDVVELARVSKTTFYQQFSSKEDLMANLVDTLATEIFKEVKTSIAEEQSIAYKAYAGIRRYTEICFTDLKVANLLLVESVGISQDVEKVRTKAHRQFADLIFQTVQGLLPTNVPQEEMLIVSQAMVGAINEVIVQNYNESGNQLNFDRVARLLNRIVLGAFINLSL